MPPRRVSTFVFAAALCLVTFLLLSNSHSGPASQAPVQGPIFFKGTLPTFEIPNFHFSFQKSSHKPPEQKNSTSGGSSWYSDWKWLNPFSSSVTLDENRSVLPPLPARPPVYTYYEVLSEKSEDILDVDRAFLQTWRQAWWAKGFRPIVLSEAEAMDNPLYQMMQGKGLSKGMEFEISRWLAWGHMGTGLFSSWHCVPMGAYDDNLLSYLRRGQFEQLTRFEGLGAGLFVGGKDQINEAIKGVLLDLKLNTFKSVTEAIDPGKFRIEKDTAIAHYDSATIKSKYPSLAKKMETEGLAGRREINNLIISHLHGTWQNIFSSGIAVLKPLPTHTTALIDPSLRLAKLLAECPESLLQSSCPPNRPKCAPCVGKKMRIATPASFRNTSTLFTISTIPHPYTMITLNNQSDAITVSHIRRYTDRDSWVTAVTRDVLGDGRGGPSRIMALKEAVASETGQGRSLWFTVEESPPSLNPPPPPPKSPTNEAHPHEEMVLPLPEEWLSRLDWHFGFPIPRKKVSHGESFPPVPGPERWSNAIPGLPAERKKSSDPNPPTELEMQIEVNLLQKARTAIGGSASATPAHMVAVAEAWNLADTEVWKFIRAFGARATVERLQWLEEEAAYEDGTSKGHSRWWKL